MAKVAAPKSTKSTSKKCAIVATPKVTKATKVVKTAEKKITEKKVPVKKASPKIEKKITAVFEANCPLATTVSVAGTFNNWTVDKDMLKKDKKSGLWIAKINLIPGDYEYKFICDGINWDEGDNKIKHV